MNIRNGPMTVDVLVFGMQADQVGRTDNGYLYSFLGNLKIPWLPTSVPNVLNDAFISLGPALRGSESAGATEAIWCFQHLTRHL